MGSEWIEAPASEFCDSVRDGTHDSPKQVESGKLLVTSRHITGNRLDLDSAYRISDEDYDEVNRRSKVDQWDVLFTMIGTVGEPCLVSSVPEFAIKNIGLFKSKTETRGKYLYYYLCSPEAQHHTASRSRGTTQQYIPLGELRTFPVRYPARESEMQSITHILGTLDDKIELNRRMNETLEAMAQALFKSWFADFDPVIDKALAAGHPIPEPLHKRAEARQALGNRRKPLPAEIAQHFPARFVFSDEMGWIPEGWELKPLDKIAHYQNGLALQRFRPENEEDFLPVVKIAQLRSGYADSGEKASTNIKPECIIDDGDVVFSWSGSLMVDIWCGGKAALNQHLFKVTSAEFPKTFYYHYTQHHLREFQRIAAGKAVTMGHIKREHLKQAYCAVPSRDLIETHERMSVTWLEKAILCRIENRQLASARDTLLPKLLSGELRIPDAEKRIEEAL